MDSEKKFDAAIWDMDGTMFDTEKLHTRFWEIVCERHGFKNSRPTIMKVIGQNEKHANEIWKRDLGPDFQPDVLRAEKNAEIDAFIEKEGLPLKKGLMEALQWMERHGLKNAVASSSRHEKIMKHLNHAGLAHHFGAVVGGDQVERSKPFPDIFLEAAKQLGVAPERCLAFEDSHNGVIAALDAGMHVVMIPDLLEPTEEILRRVHQTAVSLEEAIPYLETIVGNVHT